MNVGFPKIEIPREERSGFRRATQTPRKRLKFPVSSSLKDPVRRVLFRWLKFNFVGGIGIGVQLGALACFRSILQMDYLLSTVLAVEMAVIHNFFWHERFTWLDRPAGPRRSLVRFAKFNLTNGAVSLVGNVLVMRTLVGQFSVNYLIANLIAVTVCSLLNFLLSDRLVFEDEAKGKPRAASSR
jgi:putative flippase GtrA